MSQFSIWGAVVTLIRNLLASHSQIQMSSLGHPCFGQAWLRTIPRGSRGRPESFSFWSVWMSICWSALWPHRLWCHLDSQTSSAMPYLQITTAHALTIYISLIRTLLQQAANWTSPFCPSCSQHSMQGKPPPPCSSFILVFHKVSIQTYAIRSLVV